MKLLVVDDHPVVLDGLVALLRHSEPGLTVLQAADAAAGLELLDRNADTAAVLLDLAMPGLSGLDAIDAFRQAGPGLAIIVVSAQEGAEDIRRAMARGARGFIPKSSRPQTLVAAVRLVLSGETYVPPHVLGHDEPESGGKLTRRQVEILEALSAGHSNKEIAAAFGLSDKTIKAHVSAIFRVLNVVNRTQAAAAHRAKAR